MFVLKIGGDKNINIAYIAEDLKSILESGQKCIVVHGAHQERDELCDKLGINIKTLQSPSCIESRYTDIEMLEATMMAYTGLVNTNIVSTFREKGINAIGLSGVDGGLIIAKHKDKVLSIENGKTKVIRDNLTGKITAINIALLELLLENGYVPVVSIPAISESGQVLNVDNDAVVTMIAKGLGINKIISLFSESGFLKDIDDKESVIKEISVADLEKYMDMAKGRMKQKVISAVDAIHSNIEEVYWGDGRIEKPISSALSGGGTIIKKYNV
jgi:[amino group carrier protein]-L-2-aminoadipate 6-kinase